MAHGITGKLRGMLAAFVAVIATLALVPAMAFAVTYVEAPETTFDVDVTTGAETGSLTVNGLEPGDTVKAYRFIESTYDADTNSLETRLVATGVSFTLDDIVKNANNADTIKDYADELAGVYANKQTTYTGTANESGTAQIDSLPFGEYLLVVTHGDNTSTVVYQNTIVNFVPGLVDGAYKFDGEQEITIKKTDIGESFAENGKQVKNDGAWAKVSDDYGKNNTWAEFQITALVPAYAADAPVANKTFKITDVFPAQLKGVQDLTVTANDGTTVNADVTYTGGSADQATGFVVDMSGEAFAQLAGKTSVTISYKAQVQADSMVPGTAYTNTATLEFSSNPFVSADGGKAEDTADVKNYGAFIKKVDEDGHALPNAVFELTFGDESIAEDLTTNDEGYVWVTGLGEGSYTFTETAAPDGYELAANPAKTVTVNESAATASLSDYTTGMVDFGEIVNVEAVLGGLLPTTGGMGTVAFTAAGVVIMAGAATFIVRARKNNN